MRITQRMLIIGFVALAGCESDKRVGGVTTGEVIQLTNAQAAALVGHMSAFSSTDPSLAALADSARFALRAGAEARQIAVTTDIGPGPFWAVSMQRTHTGTTQSWSTFHVIAFNEPDNPTKFIVLGGFASNSGGAPPNTVTGSYSGPTSTSSVTAHLFTVAGNQASAWHASAGTSTLTVTPAIEQCPGFSATNMTCLKSTMAAAFTITASVPGNGSTGVRLGSSSGTVSIPGIRLSF